YSSSVSAEECATIQDRLSCPTRRSSDLNTGRNGIRTASFACRPIPTTRWSTRCSTAWRRPWPAGAALPLRCCGSGVMASGCANRSEEHTSELQSRENLVCRLLLEKKNQV